MATSLSITGKVHQCGQPKCLIVTKAGIKQSLNVGGGDPPFAPEACDGIYDALPAKLAELAFGCLCYVSHDG
jgi:hypothetical protein